jgi:hypothetical protein
VRKLTWLVRIEEALSCLALERCVPTSAIKAPVRPNRIEQGKSDTKGALILDHIGSTNHEKI